MNYRPGPAPAQEHVSEYLRLELHRLGRLVRDDVDRVAYLTNPVTPTWAANNLKATELANGNVLRFSASTTQTLTGIAIRQPGRQYGIVNIGAGTIVLASEDVGSSASNRFALANPISLSKNAAVIIWYDALSSRWRALGKA